ncbi:MAG: hypothetical protein ACE5F1_08185 [Planctomycetota bacterium]
MKVLALLFCLQASEVALQHAFVELEAERDRYYVHQVIRLSLRFGVEEDFLRTRMVQLFRRHLDVPVRIDGLEKLPGAERLADLGRSPGDRRRRMSFVLDKELAWAVLLDEKRIQSGRSMLVLELTLRYLPTRAGPLRIVGLRMQFAHATRFRQDFLEGRVPLDRRESALLAESLELDIEPLPEEGRPREFSGAVGRFKLRAEAEPRKLELGRSLELTLRIAGQGELRHFDPPRLDGLPGFHVYGRIEDAGRTERRITYSIAPLSEAVREVPGLVFSFFDPDAGYRSAHTEAIPLEVLPGRPLPLPVTRDEPREEAGFDIKGIKRIPGAAAARPAMSRALVLPVLLAPWLLACGLWLGLRHSSRRKDNMREPPARDAAVVFRARLERPGADLAGALAEFLAARLECRPAAVVAPELPARLEARGVTAELAEQCHRLLDAMIAERYGAEAAAADRRAVRELAEALETCFQGRESGC